MLSKITGHWTVCVTDYADPSQRNVLITGPLWGKFTGYRSLVTAGFPAQRASDGKKVSIWWCHHVFYMSYLMWPMKSWKEPTHLSYVNSLRTSDIFKAWFPLYFGQWVVMWNYLIYMLSSHTLMLLSWLGPYSQRLIYYLIVHDVGNILGLILWSPGPLWWLINLSDSVTL